MRRAELLLAAAALLQWLSVLAVGIRADGVELGAREIVNVALLGPLTLAAAFAVAERIGGVALGAWTLLVFVAVPWVAPLFTLDSYDEAMRVEVLPLAVGLTPDAGFLEGTALLAALALLLRRTRVTAAVGGLVLAAVVVVWLTRLPFPDVSRDAFDGGMAGLREYFWSQRLLQWLPLAGVIAVGRRSIPLALALAAWVGGYALFRLAQPGVGFEDGEVFRAFLPAIPAYVLLVSAVPLLVPTLAARLGAPARPAPSP